ncbi:putative F-box protein [Cardamine amara subsp. amara]|uniref:F-box protein n=1 Tax=Cardamine amara subsp. amara TaxID=228776 RepID=A0ABD0Z0W3_CARAN
MIVPKQLQKARNYMPQLRHLQLLGNELTNTGLNAILDGCPHLEHLDLSQCFNINLVGDLKKRCLERIKDLRHSDLSTHDYPFETSFPDIDSDGDFNYLYGGFGIEFDYDSESDSSSSSSSTSVSSLGKTKS